MSTAEPSTKIGVFGGMECWITIEPNGSVLYRPTEKYIYERDQALLAAFLNGAEIKPYYKQSEMCKCKKRVIIKNPCPDCKKD
jgi:hypothetical protein